MRFEATPPGQEPIRTTPAATSGSKPNALAMTRAVIGMIENCRTKPTNTGQGILATRPKSATLRVVPMPNMMI